MEFKEPIRCVIGTIGLPGERTFFWQIKSEQITVSIKLEKQQAAVISEQLDTLISENPRSDDASISISDFIDRDPLDLPIDQFFDLLSVAFFLKEEFVAIELKAIDTSNEESISISVTLSREEAKEFCLRTNSVVSAGRAKCPFCLDVIDSTGHICVRANGYRR